MVTLFGDTAQSYYQKVAWMTAVQDADNFTPTMWYDTLEAYYRNNGLYDAVQQALHENAIWTPGMKPLRNPAHRAVEFYVAKLWPGPLERALPIVTTDPKVIQAVKQIWLWSNWGAKKQTAARWFANFGDMFIKVDEKKDDQGKVTSVYEKNVKPKYVTELEEDERGFLTYIRIDVPAGDKNHTEVWSKEQGGQRIWKHKQPLGKPLKDLGEPTEVHTFQELGFDFIPIVHAMFQDVGEDRGVACFKHALDKIDEANRQATRLHQILFRWNKPTQAITANAMDQQGKPLPPPQLTNRDGATVASGEELETGDDDLFQLPGMSKLEQMVPDLKYADALAILNAQMTEIARDLPEVLYFELQDKGDLAGIAVQRLLGPAIDKVLEARGNAESALVRANMMAMTIAKQHGLEDFKDLGDFESGALAHTFAEREVIALSPAEKAEIIKADGEAGIPLEISAKHNGFSDDEIVRMKATLEYKLLIEERIWKAALLATQAGFPLESFLQRIGISAQDLKDIGTQKLAAIKLQQEDTVPLVKQ